MKICYWSYTALWRVHLQRTRVSISASNQKKLFIFTFLDYKSFLKGQVCLREKTLEKDHNFIFLMYDQKWNWIWLEKLHFSHIIYVYLQIRPEVNLCSKLNKKHRRSYIENVQRSANNEVYACKIFAHILI